MIRRIAGLALVVLVLATVLGASAAAQDLPAGELTVVMTEIEPFVINDQGEPQGFYAEIWDEVASDLNVEYQVIWVDSFAELLLALDDGRADVAVAPLAPTAEREGMYDFTSAVVSSGPQLGFSDRLDTRPSVLRSILDWRVFRLVVIAVLGLLILAHVVWFFERGRHHDDGDFDSTYFRGIWDGLWWSTVTATTVGYGDKAPKSFGGRSIALVAMLSSLVLVGAFVSQVTSIMAEDLKPSVEALEDIDSPIGVLAGSSFAGYLEAQGAAIVGFDTQDEVFAAIKDGQVDAVVSNPFAMATLGSRFGVTPTEGVLYEEFETFGLPQGSPWREPINKALADLQASGEIAEIIKDSLN